MAFRVLDPTCATLQASPQRNQKFTWGPEGPRPLFAGPEDWAGYEYVPPTWRLFQSVHDDPWALPAMSLLHSVDQTIAFPVGQDSQGRLGWDPEWALLLAATARNKKISISAFRELAALSDPEVAHPHASGPGGGAPLPVVLARASLPAFTRLKLLDCLPHSALAIVHEGTPLTDAVVQAIAKRPSSLGQATWLLWAWLTEVAGQPQAVFPHPLPTVPVHADDSREVADMLASKIIQGVFGHLAPPGKKLALGHLTGALLAHRRAAAVQETASTLPTRPRFRNT